MNRYDTFYRRPAGQLVSAVTGRSVLPSNTTSTLPVTHNLNINPNAPPAQDDTGTGLTVTASAPLWMWGAGGLVAAFILYKALK